MEKEEKLKEILDKYIVDVGLSIGLTREEVIKELIIYLKYDLKCRR